MIRAGILLVRRSDRAPAVPLQVLATWGLLCLLVLLCLGISACAPRYRVPFTDADIPSDPALTHGILSNGFQYVLMENGTPKDRVSVHLNVFAGSVNETDAQQGVAHYLEHLLFNGSEHFKPGELVEYFQSIGMDFGADANASTSYFHTVYDLSLPKGDRSHLDDGFLVIQEYAEGALLLETEIERERGIILAEKRERDSVSYRTFKKELAFEFPGAILNRRLPIGIEPVLRTADRRLLKNFYDTWYRPDNMVLVVVGDMDVDLAESLIRDRFSSLAPRKIGKGKEPDITWKPHTGIKSFYHYEPEAGNTKITIERLTPVPFQAETIERLKAEVTADMADAMLRNRLSGMVRKQTAGLTDASVYSGRFLRNVSVAAINADCDPENWATSLVQLEKTLRQGLAFGFYQKELDRVKADFIAELDAGVKQASTRKTPTLARSLLYSIQSRRLFLSPEQEKEILEPFIRGISLEQAKQAFRESWAAPHRLVLVTGNAEIKSESLETPEQELLRVYRQSRQQAVHPYQTAESRQFPYLPAADTPLSVRGQETDVNGLGITTVDLDNLVRLNLKPTAFKKGEFLFKVVFGDGEVGIPDDIPGLAAIAESTVGLSGLGEMDADQLEAALAGREVSIGFNIEDAYFSFSGSADPQESELLFQLILAYLADPGFRSEGLALAKTQYRQMYSALKRTPDGMMRIAGNRFLAKGHPAFGMAHPDQVDRIRLQDIRSWLMPYFAKAPIEISVAGDFDPAQIIAHASSVLGALAPRENLSYPTMAPDRVGFPKGKRLDLRPDTKIDKGMIRVAFLTDDFWDIYQTRRLSMLSRVVSERLRKVIREELSASYSPYVYNSPSMIYDGYGVMQVVVNVNPDTADLVYGTIQDIIRDMAANGITAKELELVKKPVVNQLEVLKQKNAYWLNSVLADSRRHPERLEWTQSIIPDYSDVSPEDLMALARQYLDVNASAQIRILPKETAEE